MNDFKRESQVHAFVEQQLKSVKDCYVQKMYLKFTSGFPDLIVGHDTRIAFYELKVFRTSLEHSLKQFEPIQIATIGKMRRAGLNAFGLVVKNRLEAWVYIPEPLVVVNVLGLDQKLLQNPTKPWDSSEEGPAYPI